MASTGGDPALEVMKRHMRRILQPCGVEMKQDTQLAKGDLLKAHPTLPSSDTNDDLYERTPIGEGQPAPKKKGGKKKRGRAYPPLIIR